jgi:hypothetical protein
MELDDLKASWQKLERRVEELTAINRRLMTDTIIRKARWKLAPVIAGAVANIVLGAFFAVVSASIWSSHLDAPPALFGGLALHAMSILFIVIGVGRLALARRIEFTRPVLEIQRSLASLQKWEAWSFHAAWVGCCLLFLAVVVAIAMSTMGMRFWERAPGYLLANMLVWLAIGLAPPLLHAWSRRHHGRLAARMDAFLTSHSIARARALIDEIDEFAKT